jgi:cell wall-associated NlpC family hydrolase
MVSQLVFGETLEVMGIMPEWIRVRADFDGYEGWCQQSHIVLSKQSTNTKIHNLLCAGWIGNLESRTSILKIPFGATLELDRKNHLAWSETRMKFRGKSWDALKMKKTKSKIRWCASQFLETPYLWGGKTVFGTDCSGFTQTVFKFFSIHLRRDAWQQAEQGQKVDNIRQAKCGDLAFFSNETERITHVGILLGKQKIIHASGKVRIDFVDEAGIRNGQTGERTHKLAIVKRFF